MDDSKLILDIYPSGRNSAATVTVRLGTEILGCDTFHLASAKRRAQFAAAVCEGRPGIDTAALEAELLRAAADLAARSRSGNGSQPVGEMADIDTSRIVRPELFFTSEVAGVTIPIMFQGDDAIAGKWMLYLRWGDGKRERRPLVSFLDVPNQDGRLWLFPQPVAPGPSIAPGWSADARRRWLAGQPAPNAAELFHNLAERFAEFVDLPIESGPGITATIVLWIMLTYVYPAWPAVPYLYVTGPLGSGKTRVLEILSRLVFRPVISSNMTAAALFRTLHAQGGVLLLDEAERLKLRDPEATEILTLLLAGYRRGGAALRLEPVDDSFRTVAFTVYGPKGLSSISALPTTLASRAIPIMMFRAPPGSEKPKRRLDANPATWQCLRDDLHAVALEYGPAWLEHANRTDVVPTELSARDFELWQPLLAIAAVVEESGLPGLVKLVQSQAIETTDMVKDDTQPDQDVALLRALAKEILGGRYPTPGEVLASAQEAEPTAFKGWSARAVTARLKRYGIPTPSVTKSGRRREFRGVTAEHLARITRAYGIEFDTDE